jgi:long-chain acyl-CoA synthetase
MNVFPADLEAALDAQAAVKRSVVLGINPNHGDTRIEAALILNAGTDDPRVRQRQLADAVRSANAQLSPHQHIARAVIWHETDFPRTPTGAVERDAVRTALQSDDAPHPDRAPTGDKEASFEQLRQVIADVAGIDASMLGPETRLDADIGLGSLAQVELIVSLEKTFNLSLDDSEFAEVEDLGQLLALLRQGGSASQGPVYPAWPLQQPAVVTRDLLQRSLVFNLHRLIARPFEVLDNERLANCRPPLLFIANHSSHVDTLSVIRALPRDIRRRTAVAAAADYFFKSDLIGSLTSLLLNTFAFSRGAQVRRSLEYCADLTQAGWSILIYPEGTRSTTGKLLPFKHGIGLLVDALKVPVVPIAVHGGFSILPKGRSWPRPGPARVVFGEPVRLQEGMEARDTVDVLQRVLADLVEQTRPEIEQ